jgi:hypothetical protein
VNGKKRQKALAVEIGFLSLCLVEVFSPCPLSPMLRCWQHSATLPLVIISPGLKHPQNQVIADAFLCFDDDLVEMVR